MPYFQYRRSVRFVAGALLVLTVSGCGSGNVSGEVTFNGVPLSGGWVTLNYTDGKHSPVSGAIRPDGSYRIDSCPPGEVRVTIRPAHAQNQSPKNPAPKSPVPKGSKQLPFPARYADAEKTDFVVTIRGGSQQFDLDLKP